MDRRVISSALILAVSVYALYFWGELDNPPGEASTFTQNVFWITVIGFTIHAINQLILWLIYEFIIKPRRVRLPRFIFDLMGWLIMIAILLVAVRDFFGVELSGLLVTSTVASAIIGLSLQETLGNLFAGIALQVESPFSIDDWVEIGGHEGQILSQNWRAVMLLTRENHRVSLTNRYVASDKIINYSRPTQRQLHTLYIDIDYSHPPNHVKAVCWIC